MKFYKTQVLKNPFSKFVDEYVVERVKPEPPKLLQPEEPPVDIHHRLSESARYANINTKETLDIDWEGFAEAVRNGR